MRKEAVAVGEYYHVYNRGVHKQLIFLERSDYARFLFYILYFQSPTTVYNIDSLTRNTQHSVFSISAKLTQKIEKNRYVDLVAFTLMPNHFHLIVYEKEESGISRYMQRVLNAYTKYFNTKYKKSGHLFQGPYQFTRVEDNNQLLHLSAYIFRNPRELKNWSGKESKYLWSSYQDHLYRNRWGALLKFQIISEQFKNSKEYGEFVKSNSAKTDNLPENLLLE